MKSKLLQGIFAIGFSVAALVPGAQAQTMQSIEGNNVVFYYDADFWGASTPTVNGNSISFAPNSHYQLSATGLAAGDQPFAGYSVHSSSTLVVVAKGGYALNSVVDFALRGTATLATDGYAMGLLSGYLRSGIYDANGFWPSGTLMENISLPAVGLVNGNFEGIASSVGDGHSYHVLNLMGDVGLFVAHTGVGTSTAKLTEVSYAFNVSAVPEPETYMMLGAGLALVGFAARRRKQSA